MTDDSENTTSKNTKNIRKLRYIGDIKDRDFDDPNRSREAFDIIHKRYILERKRTQSLKTKIKIADKEILKLKSHISKLNQKLHEQSDNKTNSRNSCQSFQVEKD